MNNRTRAYIYITIAAISLAVITTYYPQSIGIIYDWFSPNK